MTINDENGKPVADVDCVIGRTVDGPKNPAVIVKHALITLAYYPYEVFGKVPRRLAIDEASFNVAAARCGDVDASGFAIDTWKDIADLARLGGFTIELVDGVFRAR